MIILLKDLNVPSHDGRIVPITITRHKKTKIDGSANLLFMVMDHMETQCPLDFRLQD